MSDLPFRLELPGFCPICRRRTTFQANGPWLRGTLLCSTCPNGSVPRERALALVLEEAAPNWRALRIHESSPADRGISVILARDCPGYVGSHYFADHKRGASVNGWRNEDMECQTFADAEFDLVVSLDVMEHVFNPQAAFKEIFRTLKPGGYYVCTFPIQRSQVQALGVRASISGGHITHHKEPEYHGNPINHEGALVTVDYGYSIHQLIAEWVPFDVRISRFSDREHGILGEYTEVVVCRKPGRPPPASMRSQWVRRALRTVLKRLFG